MIKFDKTRTFSHEYNSHRTNCECCFFVVFMLFSFSFRGRGVSFAGLALDIFNCIEPTNFQQKIYILLYSSSLLVKILFNFRKFQPRYICKMFSHKKEKRIGLKGLEE